MEIENNRVSFGAVNLENTKIQLEIEKMYNVDFKNSSLLTTQSMVMLELATEKVNGKDYISYSLFLYAKLIEHHQAVQVLLKRAAITSSRALVRTMIECQLNIMAILNYPEFFNDIKEYSESQRRKLINQMIEIDKKFNVVNWSQLDFSQSELNIPTSNKKLSIENDLCKKAFPNDLIRQKGFYNLYRNFSIDNHSSIESIDDFHWNNNIGNFKVSLSLLNETLDIANQVMLEVKDAVNISLLN